MKVYAILFDSYDAINKKFIEKEKFFGVEIYNEKSVLDMLSKIESMYDKDQIFESSDSTLKVHVFYGNDLHFYIKEFNFVEDI